WSKNLSTLGLSFRFQQGLARITNIYTFRFLNTLSLAQYLISRFHKTLGIINYL
ncbi:unnamed protein product, partial [Tenebrio molitor]